MKKDSKRIGNEQAKQKKVRVEKMKTLPNMILQYRQALKRVSPFRKIKKIARFCNHLLLHVVIDFLEIFEISHIFHIQSCNF